MQRSRRCQLTLSICMLAVFALAIPAFAQTVAKTDAKKTPTKPKPPEFASVAKITDGYTEIKGDGGSLFRLWKKANSGTLLAELPKDYASSSTRHFIAPTVSGGEEFAGLQSDDFYVYWKRYGKRVALIAENLEIKGSDDESKSSVKRIFTDRVLLSVPIVGMDKGKGPVIDLSSMLVGNASVFLGGGYRGQSSLISIKKAKAFPKNVEVAFEVPMSGGNLKTLHYSISKIEGTASYKPRKADQRIGYFTTSYSDYGKYEGDDSNVHYINRWHLEKRKPKLKLSPPKNQIVFYIEHTTPVRYRRWVREGILNWNKAFENVGILNAIDVRQQDKSTDQFMDLDPEDVRYNFVRWLNNNISTAIGPSRVNPLTGQILDADIVLTDGWIRTFEDQFSELMPKVAMDGMTPETLAWFAKHPNWDPRVRMAEPSSRDFIRQQLAHQAHRASMNKNQNELQTRLMGDEPMDGIVGRTSQVNGGCLAAEGRGFDVALMRMAITAMRENVLDDDKDDDKDDKKKKGDDDDDEDDDKEDEDKEQMLDGMPESFIGPLLADLVSHEVGHTLGLRHNFKASSVYTLKEMNSEELKGKKPFAGSVMDYVPTNFRVNEGKVQGDYAMIGVGPYDMWAIEYGYTFDKKGLKKILSRVAEPELAFCTDEDIYGPDPLARRYDFSKEPLEYANEQIALAQQHRGKIIDDFVKDGDAWNKARKGYLMTIALQSKSTSMMSNWVGGTFVNRDKKGDPNGRKPIVVVPAEKQREAIDFVIEHMFFDEAFGITPELLAHMTSDNFGGYFYSMTNEPAWPVHDRIMGMQASTLSQLMNPTVLRRVYDNEFRVPSDEDALTLNELLTKINVAIWQELDELPKGKFTERKPAISSLRRNLQTEYLERLFDLSSERNGAAAMKPISNLATMALGELQEKLADASEKGNLDAYTRAHLKDSHQRVTKFIESQYVVNQGDSGGGMGSFFMFGQPSEDKK